MKVRACVGAYVRVCVCARARARVCVCVCVCVCVPVTKTPDHCTRKRTGHIVSLLICVLRNDDEDED